MEFVNKIKENRKKWTEYKPLFWEYEVQANKIVAVITTICLFILLIMVVAKTLIKNFMLINSSPAEVFADRKWFCLRWNEWYNI